MSIVGLSCTNKQTKQGVRGQRDKAHTQAGTGALSCTSQQLPHNSSAHTHSWSLLCSVCIHTYRNETLSRNSPLLLNQGNTKSSVHAVWAPHQAMHARIRSKHTKRLKRALSIPQQPCPTPAQTIALHLPVTKQQHALWHWQRTKHNHRGVLSTHMPWPQPTTQAKASKQDIHVCTNTEQHTQPTNRDFRAHPMGRPTWGCLQGQRNWALWRSPPNKLLNGVQSNFNPTQPTGRLRVHPCADKQHAQHVLLCQQQQPANQHAYMSGHAYMNARGRADTYSRSAGRCVGGAPPAGAPDSGKARQEGMCVQCHWQCFVVSPIATTPIQFLKQAVTRDGPTPAGQTANATAAAVHTIPFCC